MIGFQMEIAEVLTAALLLIAALPIIAKNQRVTKLVIVDREAK